VPRNNPSLQESRPEFPEVCVVEASAGSGKTYALAARYLRLLLDPHLKLEDIPLKHILAITFTNKACLEMKARILLFLKQLALDQFEEDKDKANLLSKLGVEECPARKKAFLVMEEIIRRYNYFQVQTIDSFINAILSGCAFKLDLSSDFRIKNDYREHLAYSLDELIEQAHSDTGVREQFHQFLQNYLHLENRKSWFPKQDILEIMELLLNARNNFGLGFAKYDKGFDQIRAKREEIKELMLKLKADFPEEANGTYWRKFQNEFEDAVDANVIDEFFNPFSKEEFPLRKNGEASEKQLKLWARIKAGIPQLYQWEAFARFNPYIDIFQGVEKNFKLACREDDIMFLSELNSQAQHLFAGASVTVPELYYRLATQFTHFLVDEFQDTSILQWTNLHPMVEEALSTGGSLFYVGDKKQAIFRFRGGEVTLMDYLKEKLAAFNVHSDPLLRNFRSQKAVVEFNNAVFAPDNIRRMIAEISEHKKNSIGFSEADSAEISAIFSGSHQEYKERYDKGFVQVKPVEMENGQDARAFIKEEVYRLLDGLSGRFRPGDIALLCRSNADVELITSWLLEKKLPVESEKTLNIRENSLIKELTAFLTFLNSPIDDLAFATFILGEIFAGVSGISHQTIRDFLFRAGAGKRHQQRPYLYRVFRNEFPGEWERFIEEFFKTVGFVPLYELCITIMRQFQVLEHFPQAQGFFMKFLEVIKEQEEDNQNIARFLDYFADELPENLFVHVASSDSIRVVTIHKAKGLEFPAVIIPFFEINVKIGAGQSRKASFVIDSRDDHLGLTSLKTEYARYSPELELKYRQEYKKAFIDELNSLYVATTRAQYELYIFVSPRAGREFNIASLLIPPEKRECGAAAAYPPKKEKKKAHALHLGVSRYRDWIGFLKDEFEEIGRVQDYARIARGNVLHFALAGIGNLAGKAARREIAAAFESAKTEYPYFEDWESTQQTIQALVEHPRAKAFFDVPDGEVFREREMVDGFGNTKRTDRLIVREKEIVIVDYKSARATDDAYRKQIREYAQILAQIYPQRRISGYLVYLDEMSVEQVL